MELHRLEDSLLENLLVTGSTTTASVVSVVAAVAVAVVVVAVVVVSVTVRLARLAAVPPFVAAAVMGTAGTIAALSLSPLPNVLVAAVGLVALLVDLLAEDGHVVVAADGDGDGTAAVLVAGVEREAGVVVVVRVPRLDPGVRVGADALEVDVGGVVPVGAVHLRQDTALLAARALGLVERDLVLEHKEVAVGVRADVAVHGRARAVVVLHGLVRHVHVLCDGGLALGLLVLVLGHGEGSKGGDRESKELHVEDVVGVCCEVRLGRPL